MELVLQCLWVWAELIPQVRDNIPLSGTLDHSVLELYRNNSICFKTQQSNFPPSVILAFNLSVTHTELIHQHLMSWAEITTHLFSPALWQHMPQDPHGACSPEPQWNLIFELQLISPVHHDTNTPYHKASLPRWEAIHVPTTGSITSPSHDPWRMSLCSPVQKSHPIALCHSTFTALVQL